MNHNSISAAERLAAWRDSENISRPDRQRIKHKSECIPTSKKRISNKTARIYGCLIMALPIPLAGSFAYFFTSRKQGSSGIAQDIVDPIIFVMCIVFSVDGVSSLLKKSPLRLIACTIWAIIFTAFLFIWSWYATFLGG